MDQMNKKLTGIVALHAKYQCALSL